MVRKLVVSSFVVLFTAACGGSSESNVMVSDLMTFAVLETRTLSLTDQYGADIAAHNFTASADVPTVGAATMTGIIGIGGLGAMTDIDQVAALGQIDIAVDFASNAVDGVAHGFYYLETGQGYAGSLILDADIARGDDVTFEGALTGTLSRGDVDRVLSADVSGGFLGAAAGGLYGSGAGTNDRSDGERFDIGVQLIAD